MTPRINVYKMVSHKFILLSLQFPYVIAETCAAFDLPSYIPNVKTKIAKTPFFSYVIV